jgi:CCR4-NOT transcription complex subunit 6
VYKQRTRSKSDGCGIFFRHNKYQLVATKPVEFNNIARVGELYDELALTDNVAVMIILKVRTPGAPIARKEPQPKIDVHTDNIQEQYLCIVNTHLFWNPSFPDIKAAQCHYLLSETKQFLSTHFGTTCEKCPILFCGDFNSMPDSDVYKLLTQGQVSIVRVNPLKKKLKTINQVSWYATHKVEDDEEDGENEVVVTPIDEETIQEKEFIEGYHEIATFTNPLDLTSGYALACGQEPSFTNYTASFNGTLDYIFLGKVKSETPAPLRVREALNVIDETAAKEFNGLPSPKFPSDHLALLLSVQILRN